MENLDANFYYSRLQLSFAFDSDYDLQTQYMTPQSGIFTQLHILSKHSKLSVEAKRNVDLLKSKLKNFCEACSADEVVLFEKSTFLVIANHDAKSHKDVH